MDFEKVACFYNQFYFIIRTFNDSIPTYCERSPSNEFICVIPNICNEIALTMNKDVYSHNLYK